MPYLSTASYIICADGGANRLFDMMKIHGKESTDVRNYYPNSLVKRYDTGSHSQ